MARASEEGSECVGSAAAGATGSRAVLLLSLGACLGLALAALGLLEPSATAPPLPDDAVASVNGHAIRTRDYLRTVAALEADRRAPVDDADRRHVLDRLVDEELLLQRGLELGLVRHEPRVRAGLVSAVIRSAVAIADEEEPDRATLEQFYREERGFFTRAGRASVRQIFVRAGTTRSPAEAQARARQAAEALRAGESFDTVATRFGDAALAPLPRGMLPPGKLREYLGPTLAEVALALAAGEVADPVESASGWHVLHVVDRTAPSVPPFDEIESQVLAEYRRRAGDRALRRYLDELRTRSSIEQREPLP